MIFCTSMLPISIYARCMTIRCDCLNNVSLESELAELRVSDTVHVAFGGGAGSQPTNVTRYKFSTRAPSNQMVHVSPV